MKMMTLHPASDLMLSTKEALVSLSRGAVASLGTKARKPSLLETQKWGT
jgi:hypothetical protein